MKNIRYKLQQQTINHLEKRLAILGDDNKSLKEENKELRNLSETLLKLKKEYEALIVEVKEQREKYKEALKECNALKAKYKKTMDDMLKSIKEEV